MQQANRDAIDAKVIEMEFGNKITPGRLPFQCNRLGCEETFCYRCSNEFGAICESCFQELIMAGYMSRKFFMNLKKKPHNRKTYTKEEYNCVLKTRGTAWPMYVFTIKYPWVKIWKEKIEEHKRVDPNEKST